jgi:hypothetical protein
MLSASEKLTKKFNKIDTNLKKVAPNNEIENKTKLLGEKFSNCKKDYENLLHYYNIYQLRNMEKRVKEFYKELENASVFYNDIHPAISQNEAFKNTEHQKNKDKMTNKLKDKPWILDLVEGAIYYTIAAVILVGGGFYLLNNKVDESEKSRENFQKTINDKITNQDDSIIKFYKEVPDIYEAIRTGNKTTLNLVDQRLEKLERKTANYNLTFIVNEGSQKKDIKINNLNNEYMCKLFNNMDTIYSSVNEKGSVKINNKLGLYYVNGRLKSLNEFDKMKFKGLENYINSISEVNVEIAE